MPPTYVLARDHLERAAAILQGADSCSRQLRQIIQRTIGLMEEFEDQVTPEGEKVLNLEAFRRSRQGWL
ncbi:MAG TPA: hypothetical protein VL133_14395 [Devosia sp.]|nr:hypothetical protein [Devosia sp.]